MMSQCSLRILFVLLLAALSLPAIAQDGAAQAQKHIRLAFDAYNSHDYAQFTEALETATNLNPLSLATRYYLARGYALTGHPDKAMDVLEQLAKLNVDFGYADHRDFESLRDKSRFEKMVAQLESRTVPIVNGEHRHTIDQLGIIPEGIAVDPATKRLFVSSMRSGDILVLDENNALSKFATVRGESDMAAIGLFVDTSRNVLWAVGAVFEMTENFNPEAETQTGVFGFDLLSGEQTHKFLAGDAAEFFNDLSVGPDGTIYISGSDLAVIDAGSDEIRRLETKPAVSGSNGIAVSADGKRLFVSSYPAGVAVIDLKTGASRMLELPENSTLYGVDGMYFFEGDLVAVQNGVEPWRLVRIDLNDDFTAVHGIRILEFANPAIGPTTGAILGDTIYLVGQGPAPESAPSQFSEDLLPFLGKTVIFSVPLD